jgi:hypothetical protein
MLVLVNFASYMRFGLVDRRYGSETKQQAKRGKPLRNSIVLTFSPASNCGYLKDIPFGFYSLMKFIKI